MISKEIVEIGKYRVATYVPGDIKKTLKNFHENKCQGLNFHSWHEISLNDLNSISSMKELRLLIIQCDVGFPLTVLENLENLEEMSLAKFKGSIDISKLKSLRRLALDWHTNPIHGAHLSSIRELNVQKFKSALFDLSEIPGLPALEILSLSNSNIKNTSGLGKFPMLRELRLFDCKNLVEMQLIDAPNIELLFVEECKKVHNLSGLEVCTMLRKILISNCFEIDNLIFVKSLHKLKSFRFLKTKIVDGDLTPLIGIEDVFFKDSPHYNMRLCDLQSNNVN